MKIVIGSAQIGMKYGILNSRKINNKEFRKIEKLILLSDINYVDTAIDYGLSEKILGNSKLNKLNIITKINLTKNINTKIKKKNLNFFLKKKIDSSLKILNRKSLYGILIHNSADLNGTIGKNYIKILNEYKKKKLIKKIGVSIYDPSELKKIWKFWKPDIVQAPFNVFDQRLETSGWLDILKKSKVKVFVRSCFLQGLLLANCNSLFLNNKIEFELKKFRTWCDKKKISPLKACIYFVKQFKKIDFAIFGFNNYLQLNEIIKVFRSKSKIQIPRFKTNYHYLIDPRKWKKK